MRITAILRAVSLRRIGLAGLVSMCVLVGLTLLEVVPNYHVVHPHERGERWQDHPTFLVGDCIFYRATLISLLEDGDLDLRNNVAPKQYAPAANVSLGKNGEWYPKHPVLMPVVAAPFYWLAGDAGLIAFNLLQLTALAACLWYGARRHASEGISFAVVLWFAFGTMLRPAAYNFSPDVFSTLLVCLGFLAVLSRRPLLAGVLLGLGMWAKLPNVVFLPVAVLALAMQRDGRAVLRLGLGTALPLLALLALNHHMFGSPWVTPYDRVLVLQDGEWVIEPSHRTFFGVPFWTGLLSQLLDRKLGLLVACPPILLAPLGLVLLARRFPGEAVLLGGACLGQLAMFAKYEQWQASSYGPRFLMTVVAVGAWLAAPALEGILTFLRSSSTDAGHAA
jgi:4-amino-4-deoxy-L-arabinose transferase-like glycosyltransferase